MTESSIRSVFGVVPVVRHSVGFWVIAATFTAVMAYSTVPTPLYVLYEAEDGFPQFAVTFIFAAYAVGVVSSLYLAGLLSDWAGRRRMILVAVAVEVLAAALFLVGPELPGLLVARFVNGVGVGLLTATATAHLGELRARAVPAEDPTNAVTISGVANLGGLGSGPLIGGLFAEFLPAPLVLPHVVFLVLFVVALLAVSVVSETVNAPPVRPRYRPQRVSVPKRSRAVFVASSAAAFAAFAVFGLFTSLAPTFLVVTLHEADRLLAGAVSFSVFAAACVAQLLLRRASLVLQLRCALVLLPVGLVALAVGAVLTSLPLFIVGGVLAGAGVGLLFRSALATAAASGYAGRRGEVLAAVFLVAYAGLCVPVLLVGWALTAWSAQNVLVVFVVLVLAAVLVFGGRMLRQQVRAAASS